MNEVLGEGDWVGEENFQKVKVLEDRIKRLEKENKTLLHKVHDSPSPDRSRNRAPAALQNGNSADDADELENGLLDINMLLDQDIKEDEWLYVSPMLPPTPVQKKVTPREWLSEGHGRGDEDLPSLDDVRKSLIFNIDEAENLGDAPSYKQHTSNVKRRQGAGKRPPQRTTDPSPNSSQPSEDGDAIPVVKWKAKMPSEPSPSSSLSADEDVAPSRKWKVKQVPSENHHNLAVGEEGMAAAEVVAAEGSHSPHGRGGPAQTRRQEAEDVPVVKWKAKMPPDHDSSQSSDDVPVVKWKAKVPQETAVAEKRTKMPAEGQGSDVPVGKWKDREGPAARRQAKMPDDSGGSDVPVVKWKARVPEDSDVPVMRRKAKMPQDSGSSDVSGGSDVPVVKWKARVPEDSDVPVMRRKAKMLEDSSSSDVSGNSDVPVIKWKARVPEDSDVPVMRRKAKTPEDVQQSSDVPVVKWKAKMPREGSASVVKRKAKTQEEPQASDVPVVKWKAKMPEDGQSPNSFAMRKKKVPVNHQADDVPVVKWKAKVPAENGQTYMKKRPKAPEDHQASDVPVVKWKAKKPQDDNETARLNVGSSAESLKQKRSSLSPKGYRSPKKVATMPNNDSSHSSEDVPPVSHSRSHRTMSPPSPPHSPVSSSTQLPQDEPAPSKPLSRRSSFSESRSPSPPSISPQVRMAIASPILSRRTPSPSRGLTSSLNSLNSRQSPVASPVMQRRQLQYTGGGQQSPGNSRSFTGAPSPIPGGHVSRIRTPRSQSAVTSPLKGLTPPGERKHRRVLPSGPSSESVGRNRSNQSTPTGHRSAQLPSPGRDAGEDDDSWLEGCF